MTLNYPPRTIWLTGIDADVQSAKIGIHSARGGRPTIARSGDVLSTRQRSIMGHATEEERK